MSAAQTRTGVSARAEALAAAPEQGANALITLAGGLTEAEWQSRLPKDGRKVGVVVHHVASVYPLKIELAQKLAAVRALSDEQLDKTAPISLYGHAPLTCRPMLEDHAFRHSWHHLAKVRAALQK